MENENKKGENGFHGKSRHHKTKSYYMEPAKKEGEGSAAPIIKPVETVKSEGEARPPKHNRHQKHHKSGDRKPDNTERQNSPRKDENTPVSAEGAPHDGRHGHNKKHKSKHRPNAGRNNPEKQSEAPIAETQESAPAAPLKVPGIKRPQDRPSVPEIDMDEYDKIHFPSASEDITTEAPPTVQEEESVTVEVIGIRFKSNGKIYFFTPNGNKLRRGEHAIVETARGLEFGEVATGNKLVRESETVPPLRPVVRGATPADIQHHKENKEKETEAFKICNEKIAAHKLEMKLIDAQYTFDNSKLLFYFTSAGRVDFRELVKDLASVFKTRIELRQIGIRDEAKIMGGVGMCGRPLCCTLFLSDFGQVSIKMAKEQNLSLNATKISGICGRLMCCLRYEHETYEYEIKRTPPVDALVQTADGNGTVTEINPLVGTVKVRLLASPDTPPKTYKREDVVMLQKKQSKDGDKKQ